MLVLQEEEAENPEKNKFFGFFQHTSAVCECVLLASKKKRDLGCGLKILYKERPVLFPSILTEDFFAILMLN